MNPASSSSRSGGRPRRHADAECQALATAVRAHRGQPADGAAVSFQELAGAPLPRRRRPGLELEDRRRVEAVRRARRARSSRSLSLTMPTSTPSSITGSAPILRRRISAAASSIGVLGVVVAGAGVVAGSRRSSRGPRRRGRRGRSRCRSAVRRRAPGVGGCAVVATCRGRWRRRRRAEWSRPAWSCNRERPSESPYRGRRTVLVGAAGDDNGPQAAPFSLGRSREDPARRDRARRCRTRDARSEVEERPHRQEVGDPDRLQRRRHDRQGARSPGPRGEPRRSDGAPGRRADRRSGRRRHDDLDDPGSRDLRGGPAQRGGGRERRRPQTWPRARAPRRGRRRGKMSRPVSSRKEKVQIATISAHNDP